MNNIYNHVIKKFIIIMDNADTKNNNNITKS